MPDTTGRSAAPRQVPGDLSDRPAPRASARALRRSRPWPAGRLAGKGWTNRAALAARRGRTHRRARRGGPGA